MKIIGTTAGRAVVYSDGVATVRGTDIMIVGCRNEEHAIERCKANLYGFTEALDTEAQKLAEMIRNSDEWNFEALEKLCGMAGIDDEWNAADGDTFEEVAYKAAEILGVNI